MAKLEKSMEYSTEINDEWPPTTSTKKSPVNTTNETKTPLQKSQKIIHHIYSHQSFGMNNVALPDSKILNNNPQTMTIRDSISGSKLTPDEICWKIYLHRTRHLRGFHGVNENDKMDNILSRQPQLDGIAGRNVKTENQNISPLRSNFFYPTNGNNNKKHHIINKKLEVKKNKHKSNKIVPAITGERVESARNGRLEEFGNISLGENKSRRVPMLCTFQVDAESELSKYGSNYQINFGSRGNNGTPHPHSQLNLGGVRVSNEQSLPGPLSGSIAKNDSPNSKASPHHPLTIDIHQYFRGIIQPPLKQHPYMTITYNKLFEESMERNKGREYFFCPVCNKLQNCQIEKDRIICIRCYTAICAYCRCKVTPNHLLFGNMNSCYSLVNRKWGNSSIRSKGTPHTKCYTKLLIFLLILLLSPLISLFLVPFVVSRSIYINLRDKYYTRITKHWLSNLDIGRLDKSTSDVSLSVICLGESHTNTGIIQQPVLNNNLKLPKMRYCESCSLLNAMCAFILLVIFTPLVIVGIICTEIICFGRSICRSATLNKEDVPHFIMKNQLLNRL